MIDIRNIGIFVKFIEPKYSTSFLNKGAIHFTPLKHFIDLEKNEDDHIIGDEHEGEIAIKFGSETTMTVMPLTNDGYPNGDKISIRPKSSEFKQGLQEEDKEKIGIASFIYLSFKDYKLIRKDAENYYYLLDTKVIDWLKKFNYDNRKMVVIYDYFKLLRKSDNKGISRKLVEYYDNKWSEVEREKSYAEYAFMKRATYKNQREFRLAVRLKKPSAGENIKVGSINSFSRVFTYDELAHLGLILSKPIRE